MLKTSRLRAPAKLLLIASCCASAASSASPREDRHASGAVTACSTSHQVLMASDIAPATDLGQISRLVSSDAWATDALTVTSARSLSGACISKVDGYDGSNLGYKGGTLVRTVNDGLQDVPQSEQKGIYERLYQRTHNSPGAPSTWSGGTLASGVQLGAARCPSPAGVYLSSWRKGDSTLLGVYSRDSGNGAVSDVKRLATVNGPVRAVGFLPSPDTDDGQLYLSIENGEKLELVTVRLTGIEGLAGCP